MFAHFETTSRREREEIAAQIAHAESIGKLGAIQGVFEILVIEYEPGQPFPV